MVGRAWALGAGLCVAACGSDPGGDGAETGPDGTSSGSASPASDSPASASTEPGEDDDDPATGSSSTTPPPTGTGTGDGPIAVASVSPADQTVGADRGAPIVVELDGSVDEATVNNASLSVFGRWSGVAAGEIAVEDNGGRIVFTPAAPFMAGEWVNVTLSNALTSTSGEPLATGYAFGFWAAAAAGTLDLTLADQRSSRQAGEGWIQSYGAYAGDLDGDGYSDLMIPNEQADDVRIFLNDGAGGYPDFTVTPIPGGSVPSTNEGADFNGDGVIDFAVGNAGGTMVSVFIGVGDGSATHDANYAVGQSVRGLCVLDLDSDGDPDLVSVSRVGAGDGDISLLINDGGSFVVAETLNPGGGGETSCAAGDANGDGIADVFIGALESDEVFLYTSDGAGTLTLADQTATSGGPWMLAAGDVDGDGNVDVVSSDFQGNSMSVVRTDGDGGLEAADIYPVGQNPLAIDLGDIDGDGDLDAVTSNLNSASFTLYANDGAGTFAAPRTLASSSAGSCAIVHDRDNDGDLDLTAIDEFDDIIFLFENE